MNKVDFIWMDGKMVAWEEAKTHVLTHTLHYSGGAFEGIRFYETEQGSAIFRLPEHLKRLYYSASCLDIKIKYTPEQLTEAIFKLIKKNKIKEGYIRPLAYYGYGKMGLDTRGAPSNIAIACWPWGAYLEKKAIRAQISSFIRIHQKSTFVEAKLCGHYLNSIVSGMEAHKNGYDEAILMDYKGNVAEGPGENIFIVKNKVLMTPKRGSILPGITRDSILKIAKDLKLKTKECTITKKTLMNADEIFYTGTAIEVAPIMVINKKKFIKKNTISDQLKKTYYDVVRGKNNRYTKWLTFIK